VGAKAEELVDADSDELYLDSDVSADNESWQQLAKNFVVKPSDSKLPKMELSELKSQAEFRRGYHMVKPRELESWDQLQTVFAIPNDPHRRSTKGGALPHVSGPQLRLRPVGFRSQKHVGLLPRAAPS
jgi:hypothetical protein